MHRPDAAGGQGLVARRRGLTWASVARLERDVARALSELGAHTAAVRIQQRRGLRVRRALLHVVPLCDHCRAVGRDKDAPHPRVGRCAEPASLSQ
eukprot:scaffold31507_cov101-Isochrysis_galbana.AAC.4